MRQDAPTARFALTLLLVVSKTLQGGGRHVTLHSHGPRGAVLVMYAGRVVEEGTLDEVFYDPQHPYTWGLLGSVPRIDRSRGERLPAIPGTPPSLLQPPEGCHFRPRCPHAFEKCTDVPPLESRVPGNEGHRDRCWLDVEEKRSRRQVGEQIGLAADGSVPA